MRVPIFAVTACLNAASCTSSVAVRPADIDSLPVRVSEGRYAAVITTGGWTLRAKSDGLVCGEWSFDADMNAAFAETMRGTLKRSLDHVDFFEEPIAFEHIRERGYRAVITIRQENARAGFTASERILFRDIRSKVSLAAALSVSDERGVAFQRSLNGSGTRDRQVFVCSTIGEVVGQSARDALQALANDAAEHISAATRRVSPR